MLIWNAILIAYSIVLIGSSTIDLHNLETVIFTYIHVNIMTMNVDETTVFMLHT